VLGGTVPSSLAAAAPIVGWLTADAARVRNDRSGEMRHGCGCSFGTAGGWMSGKQLDGHLWLLYPSNQECITTIEGLSSEPAAGTGTNERR
jgi:hypothetical protein